MCVCVCVCVLWLRAPMLSDSPKRPCKRIHPPVSIHLVFQRSGWVKEESATVEKNSSIHHAAAPTDKKEEGHSNERLKPSDLSCAKSHTGQHV